MNKTRTRTFYTLAFALVLTVLMGLPATESAAQIDGVSGTSFNLTATSGYITTSDGDSFLMWGFGLNGVMQYPSPTLIVTEGDTVTVILKNSLPPQSGNVSIVFPGLSVSATGGVDGLLTKEAPPDGTTQVTYTFTAVHPGTYLYRSGTRPDLQIEMGLAGAIIVRPAMGANYAYNHANTHFDREFLYLITEMDPNIHRKVEYGQWNQIDMTRYFPTNWFINGRNFPDLMSDPGVPWLPNQPYNCQPRMHPGETVLVRLIGAGVDGHPMHLHGNDFETIAEDARLNESAPGNGPDLAWKATTIRTVPGQTADVLWTWTGEGIGWDIYGHLPGDPLAPGEDPQYHGVQFPVILPDQSAVTYGQFYSGSPFLGGVGDLAPGDAGLNANGGYFYMWHSHTEKELTSNAIWPGGLVTFMIVEHPDVPLP
jgi:FtsP/CotA-like multicopper oxidase with cupredoxin domain